MIVDRLTMVGFGLFTLQQPAYMYVHACECTSNQCICRQSNPHPYTHVHTMKQFVLERTWNKCHEPHTGSNHGSTHVHVYMKPGDNIELPIT